MPMQSTRSDAIAKRPWLGIDELLEPDQTASVALFRSLADPTRLRILRHLALGEHRVVDLTAHLALAQSTVSQHLACLRDCGLVSSRADGRASMFSLATAPELLDLLAAAERVLVATGNAAEHCPTSGPAAPASREH